MAPTTLPNLNNLELGRNDFEKISRLIHRLCGINLTHGKEGLIKMRLAKRLRALGLSNFDQYLNYVEADRSRQELALMVDALTTNKTSFFREPPHFEYLRQKVLPKLKDEQRKMRFWSAGCSSGEEPFSLAIVLREEIQDIKGLDVRILATDISGKILKIAQEAIYEEETLGDVPAPLVKKYFTCVKSDPPRSHRVKENLRAMVRLARLNLMGPWPMKGPFDVIFCRNVMIYFDKQTQRVLVHRFWDMLRPGGYLFVGHSESLIASSGEFRYVQPAIYAK